MITLGEIQTIDFNSNTCIVRVPLFENTSNSLPITISAHFLMMPGVYNGYTVSDVVYVSFVENKLGDAIILGKVYFGANTESQKNVGAISCDNLSFNYCEQIDTLTKRILVLEDSINKLNSRITELTNK